MCEAALLNPGCRPSDERGRADRPEAAPDAGSPACRARRGSRGNRRSGYLRERWMRSARATPPSNVATPRTVPQGTFLRAAALS